MRRDGLRGGYCELHASSLTDSRFVRGPLVDTVITSNPLLALRLSPKKDGRGGRGVHLLAWQTSTPRWKG
jgi:hypothetical protein